MSCFACFCFASSCFACSQVALLCLVCSCVAYGRNSLQRCNCTTLSDHMLLLHMFLFRMLLLRMFLAPRTPALHAPTLLAAALNVSCLTYSCCASSCRSKFLLWMVFRRFLPLLLPSTLMLDACYRIHGRETCTIQTCYRTTRIRTPVSVGQCVVLRKPTVLCYFRKH